MADLVRRLRRHTAFELAFTLAVALGLVAAMQAYAVKPYRVPSESMVPTLQVGQRVLVDRLSHGLGSTPKVGDIVVFMPPAGAADKVCGAKGQGDGTPIPCGRTVARRGSQPFIKRVVAVAGDTIAIRNGHAVRNGKVAREPFITPCAGGSHCNFRQSITVPPGSVYVMGDNRGNSDDSRYWGPVPVSAVIGTAFATYWPPDRIGGF